MLFLDILGIVGGITVFMLGLRFIALNVCAIFNGKMSSVIYKATLNRFFAVGIGAGVTALAQSSVAINLALVSLVESGYLSLMGAMAVVIGSNVGTTVTAQLTSLSFGSFDIFSLGAFLSFVGFIVSVFGKGKTGALGEAVLGFGLVFIGIDILSDKVESFYGYRWFRNFFLNDNGLILALNGFFITAVCQSSSVVSSMLVILSAGGLISFDKVVFLLLGANVGTTIPVLILSRKKSLASRRVAFFNFLFNILGSTVFFAAACLFGESISGAFFSSSLSAGRAVANFHTFFNLATAVVTLPVLRPLSLLCSAIVKDDKYTPKRAARGKNAGKSLFGGGQTIDIRR